MYLKKFEKQEIYVQEQIFILYALKISRIFFLLSSSSNEKSHVMMSRMYVLKNKSNEPFIKQSTHSFVRHKKI